MNLFVCSYSALLFWFVTAGKLDFELVVKMESVF